MTGIPTALDALAAQLQTALGRPVTRDPAKVRAHLAADNLCVYVRPAQVVGRTGGGLQLEVPVSVVLPTTDSMADNDRAYPVCEELLLLLGQNTTDRDGVNVGQDRYPAHTITARIGA